MWICEYLTEMFPAYKAFFLFYGFNSILKETNACISFSRGMETILVYSFF